MKPIHWDQKSISKSASRIMDKLQSFSNSSVVDLLTMPQTDYCTDGQAVRGVPHGKDKIPNFRNKYYLKKGISGSRSQFPHSCDLYISTIGLPILLEEICRPRDYINRSQTHECWNWGWGHAIPRKGIHKWDFVAVLNIGCTTFFSLDSTFKERYFAIPAFPLLIKERYVFVW